MHLNTKSIFMAEQNTIEVKFLEFSERNDSYHLVPNQETWAQEDYFIFSNWETLFVCDDYVHTKRLLGKNAKHSQLHIIDQRGCDQSEQYCRFNAWRTQQDKPPRAVILLIVDSNFSRDAVSEIFNAHKDKFVEIEAKIEEAKVAAEAEAKRHAADLEEIKATYQKTSLEREAADAKREAHLEELKKELEKKTEMLAMRAMQQKAVPVRQEEAAAGLEKPLAMQQKAAPERPKATEKLQLNQPQTSPISASEEDLSKNMNAAFEKYFPVLDEKIAPIGNDAPTAPNIFAEDLSKKENDELTIDPLRPQEMLSKTAEIADEFSFYLYYPFRVRGSNENVIQYGGPEFWFTDTALDMATIKPKIYPDGKSFCFCYDLDASNEQTPTFKSEEQLPSTTEETITIWYIDRTQNSKAVECQLEWIIEERDKWGDQWINKNNPTPIVSLHYAIVVGQGAFKEFKAKWDATAYEFKVEDVVEAKSRKDLESTETDNIISTANTSAEPIITASQGIIHPTKKLESGAVIPEIKHPYTRSQHDSILEVLEDNTLQTTTQAQSQSLEIKPIPSTKNCNQTIPSTELSLRSTNLTEESADSPFDLQTICLGTQSRELLNKIVDLAASLAYPIICPAEMKEDALITVYYVDATDQENEQRQKDWIRQNGTRTAKCDDYALICGTGPINTFREKLNEVIQPPRATEKVQLNQSQTPPISASEALKLIALFIGLIASCILLGFFIGGFANAWDGIDLFLEAIKLGTDWGIGVLCASFVVSFVATLIAGKIRLFSDALSNSEPNQLIDGDNKQHHTVLMTDNSKNNSLTTQHDQVWTPGTNPSTEKFNNIDQETGLPRPIVTQK